LLVLLLLGVLEVHRLGLLLRVLEDLGVDGDRGRLHLDLHGQHLVDPLFEVGQDPLQLLLTELLEALLQLLAGCPQLIGGAAKVVAGLRPLVLVEGARRVLLVRDRSANLVGPRGLRGVRRRGARRRAASRRLRLAGRAATRRRAGALAGAGLGVALGADGRALLVALVVFLIARL